MATQPLAIPIFALVQADAEAAQQAVARHVSERDAEMERAEKEITRTQRLEEQLQVRTGYCLLLLLPLPS